MKNTFLLFSQQSIIPYISKQHQFLKLHSIITNIGIWSRTELLNIHGVMKPMTIHIPLPFLQQTKLDYTNGMNTQMDIITIHYE